MFCQYHTYRKSGNDWDVALGLGNIDKKIRRLVNMFLYFANIGPLLCAAGACVVNITHIYYIKSSND